MKIEKIRYTNIMRKKLQKENEEILRRIKVGRRQIRKGEKND